MSFELNSGTSFRKNIRRIARNQLDSALDDLTAEGGSRDDAVHEVRKHFKKIRAVLRLVRPVIGEKAYKAENKCFRDAARPLAELRDAKVFVETLDDLIEHFQQHLSGGALSNLREELQQHLVNVRTRMLDDESTFDVTAKLVRKARERVKKWADVPNRWHTVGRGLEDTYRSALAAFEVAVGDPSGEKLHEWRKCAKYLHYQLEILRPLCPERLHELGSETDQMRDLLGEHHDLAVLQDKLTDSTERFGDPADLDLLLPLANNRRAELVQESIVLGERFFQDRPKEFIRVLKGYWKRWR